MSDSDSRTKNKASSKPTGQGYPFWSPRFWHGMRTGDWLKLVVENRFRFSPTRLGLGFTVSCVTPFNTVMSLLQRVMRGRAIDQTEIVEPPIFIVGHWRSGTTYLHELLVRDERYGYPTTYECFAPTHFLMTEWIVPSLVGFLLPTKRPMDNMGAGFSLPQEDEFALCNMGSPTPYRRMAFPNEPGCFMELLDMQNVSDEVMSRWKRDMRWFAKALTLYKKKQLVLKSPPHTGRIEVLSQLFPGAKFIHITRDPKSLFLSTRRLWPSLDEAQGLQVPKNRQLDEYIFECFDRMYRGFEDQRTRMDPDSIVDVRYEDLVVDPVAQVKQLYERLQIGDFETMRESLEAYVNSKKDYKPNRHLELEPEIEQQIKQRWAGYIEKYGYGDHADFRDG